MNDWDSTPIVGLSQAEQTPTFANSSMLPEPVETTMQGLWAANAVDNATASRVEIPVPPTAAENSPPLIAIGPTVDPGFDAMQSTCSSPGLSWVSPYDDVPIPDSFGWAIDQNRALDALAGPTADIPNWVTPWDDPTVNSSEPATLPRLDLGFGIQADEAVTDDEAHTEADDGHLDSKDAVQTTADTTGDNRATQTVATGDNQASQLPVAVAPTPGAQNGWAVSVGGASVLVSESDKPTWEWVTIDGNAVLVVHVSPSAYATEFATGDVKIEIRKDLQPNPSAQAGPHYDFPEMKITIPPPHQPTPPTEGRPQAPKEAPPSQERAPSELPPQTPPVPGEPPQPVPTQPGQEPSQYGSGQPPTQPQEPSGPSVPLPIPDVISAASPLPDDPQSKPRTAFEAKAQGDPGFTPTYGLGGNQNIVGYVYHPTQGMYQARDLEGRLVWGIETEERPPDPNDLLPLSARSDLENRARDYPRTAWPQRTPWETRINGDRAYHPIWDSKKKQIVGYWTKTHNYRRTYDLNGNMTFGVGDQIVTPPVDPLDVIPFEAVGGLGAKAGRLAIRAGAEAGADALGRAAARDVGEAGPKILRSAVGTTSETVLKDRLIAGAWEELAKVPAWPFARRRARAPSTSTPLPKGRIFRT
jgi:hypothetical protein